jgi:hypothetical protein
MKLVVNQRTPYTYIASSFFAIFRDIETQVNGLSEGLQAASYLATTAAPTTGEHALGDFILNSSPSELGGAGSKYIIHGWRCTVAGTPGTWVQCRFLTGN